MPMQFMVRQMENAIAGMPTNHDQLIIELSKTNTWDQVSYITGLSRTVVAGVLKANKQDAAACRKARLRSTVRIPDETLKKAAELRAKGVTWVVIADRLGHSDYGLARAAKDRGFL